MNDKLGFATMFIARRAAFFYSRGEKCGLGDRKMKKSSLPGCLFVVMALVLCVGSVANGTNDDIDLIDPPGVPGFPRISFDTSAGPGANIYSTQGLHYDASTGFFTASGKALSINMDGTTEVPLVNGTVDLRGFFTGSDFSPPFVFGNFTTAGVPGEHDLIVQDDTGILILGTYGPRVKRGNLGAGTGISESGFTVDGGSLMPAYGGTEGRMENNMFDILPLFNEFTFSADYDGHWDGRIGPLVVPPPIPTVSEWGLIIMALLALTAGTIVFARRRRPAVA